MSDLTSRIEALSLGLRGVVRLSAVPGRPWRVTVTVQRCDPFAKRVAPPRALAATRLQVGVTEIGHPFILDFRVAPHMLMAGATGSGKSGGIASLLFALTPTDAVLALIDLKHGISAEPMRPRASVIAETREAACQILGDLLVLGEARAQLVKAAGVESVYELAEPMPEVWLIVDEVAELAIGSTKPEKDASAEAMSRLLRCAQLLRALGVHVIVAGQRFGSSTGAKVTDIRAQLGGRICFRANDAESAAMVMADVASTAAFAALEISADRPGVAVSNTGPDRWEVVRFAHVPHSALGPIALANAHRRTEWADVIAQSAPVLALVDEQIQDRLTGEPAAR